MPRIEPELQRLQEIKTLTSLLKYLREDLNWPIGSEDVEEVTFDYDPAELGFDSASTAKIDEVRQLRPLTAGQKWGIFWVKFGKKQLPVQMLRRALGNLVVKKRASTKKSDKAAWHMHDLLFISAYGDDSNRHITFAHFSESEDSETTLPVLKVLGWDDDDTLLHLKDTYKTLLTSLNWETTPTGDPEAWREHWSKAFKLTHKEVIDTTKELVVELAHLATVIKKSVLTSINAETDKGPWKKLMLAFQKTLINDLNEEQFADVIAQTVSYGLLTARLSSDGQISLKNLVDMVPSTNPFLKELLQHFLTSAGMKGLFDVDEAGINDVVELLNRANAQAIRNDFGKKTDGEDPVIHFYEHFLGAYNKKLKVERGVFYTPKPIVSYIVRSVHELLQKEFGLEDGLADTSTWAEVKERHKDLKIPEGIKPDIEPFVQILDPATGTATFLIEVIDVIHNTMTAKWDKERVSKAEQIKKWNTYVPTHLLPRLYAYELMMAPYAIAHMKVGLKLAETGFTAWEKLGPENRANIFLANALTPASDQHEFRDIVGALAHEATAVDQVKRERHFTVIIGNPPYSEKSRNNGGWISGLMEDYKTTIRNEEAQIKTVSNDYIKFMRMMHNHCERSKFAALGLITNNGYLDGRLFRDMRHSWNNCFKIIQVLNLHGSGRRGDAEASDENVFQILQGVAITLALCKGNSKPCEIDYSELIGPRLLKLNRLGSECLMRGNRLSPIEPLFLFTPSTANQTSVATWQLNEIFGTGNPSKDRNKTYAGGFKTRQDSFTVAFDESILESRIKELADPDITEESLREKYGLCSTAHFEFDKARLAASSGKLSKAIKRARYRPFDDRPMIWSREVLCEPQTEVTRHLLQPNICLISSRVVKDDSYRHVSISRGPAEVISLSTSTSTNAYMFPLYRYEADQLLNGSSDKPTRIINLNPKFIREIEELVGHVLSEDGTSRLLPETILSYIYAILHSQTYRDELSEELMRDFAQIPLPKNRETFFALSSLGQELIRQHLLEGTSPSPTSITFSGKSGNVPDKLTHENEVVWINKEKNCGFIGVSKEAWDFCVGGYLVCQKWLDDRRKAKRPLSSKDIQYYIKIVTAVSETIRLMAEVDKEIDEHGGWPGAFQAAK